MRTLDNLYRHWKIEQIQIGKSKRIHENQCITAIFETSEVDRVINHRRDPVHSENLENRKLEIECQTSNTCVQCTKTLDRIQNGASEI